MEEAGVLVDASDYYRAFFHAARAARRYIVIAGWQFDSEVCTGRLRINEAGRTFPEEAAFPLRVTFDVGSDAAVYVGLLQIERVVFARTLRITVADEYERAVPLFRERHPELPSAIARSLMQTT